ncbi:MAG: translation initiation factor IF-3 [Candidatus Moeniiplasma glomeromycotorum]|nr:translation initiation factor IF-3 [Candidatus Moeniiplasma glomeromycotorum]MCE8167136.1 translation initiation factor IF-3 [Candidatus Moeniiplasma glomeromycotorum]MCE8168852.1 translation initiation factor IF-3 [Candidatus Moeniiplasma glomeromycotorum]
MNLKKKANQPLLNENILFPRFLLISEGGEKAEVTRQEALEQAEEIGLDLLCVSTNPPVCRLVNYYELKKRKKKLKRNTVKEIKFSYNIEEGDLKVKLNKIQKLIEKGSVVKINLVRRGREKSAEKAEIGEKKCQEIIEKLRENCPWIELKGETKKTPGNFYFSLYRRKVK